MNNTLEPVEPMVIDALGLTTRELNRRIRAAAEVGGRVRVVNPEARHNIGVGLGEGVSLEIAGSAGYYAGGLNDGAEILVRGNAGWGAAESMRDGTVVIEGGAGNAVAASIRAGTVVVKGSVSTRAGIAMKGGTLLIGGDAGAGLGFMMQKGRIIIRGDAGDGVAESMYAGEVFVGGEPGALGADAVVAPIDAEELKSLLESLAQWDIPGPRSGRFVKIVSGRKLWNFERKDIHVWKSAL